MAARVKETYINEVAPALMKKFEYKSVMQIPKLDKVVINVGAGEAKENAKVSGREDRPSRWIVDDCAKFVEREIRRGKTYDAIIMDPPSYGRGPPGEVWKLEENLYPFVELVSRVLSDDPLFFIINSYTTGLDPYVKRYLTEKIVSKKYGGYTRSDELGLPERDTGLALPCGAPCRWTKEKP